MKEIVVRFKKDNSKDYEDISFPVNYEYKIGEKVIQTMNRKLSRQFKNEYICISFNYNKQQQIIFLNYLR